MGVGCEGLCYTAGMMRCAAMMLVGAVCFGAPVGAGTCEARRAPDAPASPVADLGERLAAEVERAHLGQFWGAVVVRVGGEDVLRRGYGFEGASLEPIDPGASLFDVGSVSKSLTAAAALRLIEEGSLSLETTLAEVFPGVDAGAFGAVTVRELLGHRLGVGDASVARGGADPGDRAGWVRVLGSTRAGRGRPGFAYSNVCYFLLASVVEARAGEAFEEAVRSRVIGPAALRAAGFVGDGSVDGGRATARVSERTGRATDTFAYPWNWGQRGATGVVMTADDAARWVEAAWSGAVYGPMTRGSVFDPGDSGYGMGWFVETDAEGRVRRVGHGGTTGGYACAVAHYPMAAEGRGVTIVVMTNERWDASGLEKRIARVVAPAPARPSKAAVYLARYELDGEGVLEVGEGLAWSVMPGYRGRGERGEPVVDDRPTVVLTDAGRGMWPVMVIMDHAEAGALHGSLLEAMAELAAHPDAAHEPWVGGMRMRVDVSGLELSATSHHELTPGSGWVVGTEGVRIVARLVDAESGRSLVTVRMGGAEARSLIDGLRPVID